MRSKSYAAEIAKLDKNALKVLAALCRGPSQGRQPKELWEELKSEMGKGTFYKRIETLMNDLRYIELVEHPTDRRMVIYRIKSNSLPLCIEQASGFEFFQLVEHMKMCSLEPGKPGRAKKIEVGADYMSMAVFSDRELNTASLNNLLEDEVIRSDLDRVLGRMLQRLFEGIKGDQAHSKLLLAFYHENQD